MFLFRTFPIDWTQDIEAYCPKLNPGDFKYPIIADPKRELATKLGIMDPDEKDKDGLPLTCRALFIISPDKKLKLSLRYPSNTGRNFQ
jgi:1-Cys peroxiredoxin 6